MDFSNHGVGAPQTASPMQSSGQPSLNKRRGNHGMNNPLVKWATSLFGAVIVLLIIAVILAIGLNTPKSQSGYVYTNKLQAVFLNTGQVYFGNIKEINPQFIVLTNIFYLQTNNNGSSSTSTSTSNNVSLVKLGCELHAPYDQMVINMNQVTFWENLQSDGQVAKAVTTYQREYPNGQPCKDQSSSSGSTTNSVQPAPASSTPKAP